MNEVHEVGICGTRKSWKSDKRIIRIVRAGLSYFVPSWSGPDVCKPRDSCTDFNFFQKLDSAQLHKSILEGFTVGFLKLY